MRYTLKQINIGSAFKVGIVVNALLYLVIGLLVIVFPTLLFGSIGRAAFGSSDPELNAVFNLVGTAGLLSLVCVYAIGVVFAALFGGIVFAFGAWFYNLASKWVGGIEFTLQSTPSGFLDEIEQDIADAQLKQKRSDS
jgi:hypothetical protein